MLFLRRFMFVTVCVLIGYVSVEIANMFFNKEVAFVVIVALGLLFALKGVYDIRGNKV